jgi:flavin-binding protein dodecin
MAKKVEHTGPPAVVRIVEMVGVSDKSWSDAAQQAVKRAAATVRHITGLDVLQSSAVVKDGKIVEYHVNVKLAFVVEPADLGK